MAEDAIIGSVGVSVVPDARDFWRRFQEQTKAGAVKAGEQSGKDWRRGFEAANVRPVDVRVRADTTKARAEIASLNAQGSTAFKGLINTAITLAPALVPLGAAAAAAGAEFVALGGAGLLALKGIQDQMKTGTPTGAIYGGMVRTLKSDLGQLEATASHGVLAGFEQTVGKLQRSMPQLNAVIASQSTLLGDVTSHLAGGILGGFSTFAPLLDQVGGSVDRIAAHFEAWATGPGGAKFSQTLSADYAKVAPLIDDIFHAVGHLVAASNGTGLIIVSEIGVLARVLDSFPTPVLTAIVDGIVAFRVISGINGLLTTLGGSFTFIGERATASAAAVTAANLQVQASAAAEAAAVAVSQAGVAAAYAASQAAIAEATLGEGAELSGLAAVAVETSAAEAAAFQATAVAAVAAAEEIAAAAATAAAESAAAGEAAAVGWSSMLGPIGIGVGLLGLFGLSMLGSSHSTEDATRSIQGYTSALVQSNNVINDAVRSNVAKQLSDDKAFIQAAKLGITQQELTTAIVQGGPALDGLSTRIKNIGGSSGDTQLQLAKLVGFSGKEVKDAAVSLSLTLEQEAKNFQAATQAARDQEAALAGVGNATDYTKRALSDGDTSLRGYIKALDLFNKSADTAADRGKLIGSVLVAANGDFLAFSQTMVTVSQANQQLVTDFKHLHKGVLDLSTGTIDFHNAAAAPLINDLQSLQTAAENAAAATYQHELRTKGATKAASDAFDVYRNDTRGALIDQAKQLGLTKTQAGLLADKYFGLKNSGDIKKKIELIGQDKVAQALNGILQDLDILIGKTTVLDLQIQHANAHASASSGGPVVHYADGGFITAGTGPRADDVVIRASKGEAIIPADQASKHSGLVRSLINRTDGFESGGFVGVDYSGNANKNGVVKAGHTVYIVEGQQYGSLSAAENAASRLFHADVTLGLKIDTTDMAKFRASLKGTVDQVHTSFLAMYADAQKLGVSSGFSATLRAENGRLEKEVWARDRIAAQWATTQQRLTDFKSAVSSGITGSFDITTAGTGFDGQQPVTGANILAQANQAAAKARVFVKDVELLRGKVGWQYLSALAQKGPDALPEAEALLQLNPAQLKTLQGDNLSLIGSGNALGSSIGNTLYGSSIAAYTAQLHRDNAAINTLAATMERQFESAVALYANRPIYVTVDGKVLARATAAGTVANGRRS